MSRKYYRTLQNIPTKNPTLTPEDFENIHQLFNRYRRWMIYKMRNLPPPLLKIMLKIEKVIRGGRY